MFSSVRLVRFRPLVFGGDLSPDALKAFAQYAIVWSLGERPLNSCRISLWSFFKVRPLIKRVDTTKMFERD